MPLSNSPPRPLSRHTAAPQVRPKRAVRVWVNAKGQVTLQGRLLRLLAITMGWLSAGSFVGLCLWTSAILILQSRPPAWLARALPHLAQTWSSTPVQSLEEIEAELRSRGYRVGDWIDLTPLGSDPELESLRLLPLFPTASLCAQNCEAIVQLHLYRVHSRHQATIFLQRLHQLKVQGPSEADIIDPIVQSRATVVGSTHQLPLVKLHPLQSETLPGAWLNLSGRWQRHGSPILYGQILHIHPQTLQINSLLNWHSLPGRLPTWQDLDGAGTPELVVNQSVGLEPHFSIYSVVSTTAAAVPTRLEAISLRPQPLVKINEAAHHDALFLAHNGLWSEAARQLTQLKTQLDTQWSQGLEQQLQLVTFHAVVSRSQADRNWSRPSQKLLALLLDGQWDQALEVIETPQGKTETSTMALLKRDSTRLWQRINAYLKVYPSQKSARFWGALLLLAKEGKEASLNWLNPGAGSALEKEFEAIALKVDPTFADDETKEDDPEDKSPSPLGDAITVAATGLFGTVRSGTAPDLKVWHWPAELSEPALSPGQQWYGIELQAGHFTGGWSRDLEGPAETSPEAISAFWARLGLNTDPRLELIGPGGTPTSTVQVRAARWHGGKVHLLASGVSQRNQIWGAVTLGQWTAPQQMRSESLAQVYQDNPAVGDRLIAVLDNHLGIDPTALVSALQKGRPNAGQGITVGQVDFIGNQTSEMLITLSPPAAVAWGLPRTVNDEVSLIVDESGALLYSDLWQGSNAPLVGWLAPGTGPAALVIEQDETYQLYTWSVSRQRFQ